MKKAYISPVASLLMSLSLALGILVSDLSGYRLLTTAHAQESSCGGTGGGGTVNIVDGLILSGLTVSYVVVNGTVLEKAVIADSVRISNAQVVGTSNIINAPGGGGEADGVIVGVDGVIVGVDGVIVGVDGVIVGVDGPCSNGVIVGVDNPAATPAGVIVGVDGVIVGVDGSNTISSTGGTGGMAVGGVLTGDGITVNNGVITGQNLLLSGAILDGGSIGGTIQ